MRFSTFWQVLIVLLGAASQAVGQGIHYLDDPKPQQGLPAGPTYLARIVDARPQRASLGWISRRGELPLPATFQAGLLAMLRPFFATYAPGQPGATPLVMRLTGLEVAEMLNTASLTSREIAVAGLTADFYAPQPDSSYRLVAHFAQLHEQPSSALFSDATRQHAANLGELLLAAAAHSRNQAAWLPAGPSYPAAYVLAAEPHATEALPLLRPALQPQPGFYLSLPEFWLNQPGEPGLPEVETRPYPNADWAGDLEVKPYRRTADGQRVLATSVWGFCDGKDFYIRRRQSFYRLQRQGNNFIYHGQLGDDEKFMKVANARAVNNALLFGIAAGAANAASTPSERRVLFGLSVLTGASMLDQAPTGSSASARPTHVFIYRPRSARGPAVRIRLADDQPAQELAPGDYLTFTPPSDEPLRVCLLAANGPGIYLPITPTSESATYLECRPAEAVPLQVVTDKAGSAALTRLAR